VRMDSTMFGTDFCRTTPDLRAEEEEAAARASITSAMASSKLRTGGGGTAGAMAARGMGVRKETGFLAE
jgi:hypothetical protein